jgi:hypothetical protein
LRSRCASMSPNGRTPDVDHTLRCEDPTCNPRNARRKPLADQLTCEEVCIDVGTETCACCGGALHPIGEDISEMLDWCPRSSVSSGFAAPNAAAALAELRYAPVPGRGLTTSARLARVSGRQLLRSRALVLESQISARHDVERRVMGLACLCFKLEDLWEPTPHRLVYERWPRLMSPRKKCVLEIPARRR